MEKVKLTEGDGFFRLYVIKQGEDYTLTISHIDYQTSKFQKVKVAGDSTTLIRVTLWPNDIHVDSLICTPNEQVIVSFQFGLHLYLRNMHTAKPSEHVQYNDGNIGSVRGTRDGATTTYIDGVKNQWSSIPPKTALNDTVGFEILKGIPAELKNKNGFKKKSSIE